MDGCVMCVYRRPRTNWHRGGGGFMEALNYLRRLPLQVCV
jgi:hypothetical protein